MIKLYVGAPSTRIKYVNSSLPITTGAAKSHQRAYVLHPAIVTGVAQSMVRIAERFVRIIRETRHPSKIAAKELAEKERSASFFLFPPMCKAVTALPPVANTSAIPVNTFTIG